METSEKEIEEETKRQEKDSGREDGRRNREWKRKGRQWKKRRRRTVEGLYGRTEIGFRSEGRRREEENDSSEVF